MLPTPGKWQNTVADYASTGLILGNYPLLKLRPLLTERGIITAEALSQTETGRTVSVAGLVINRQRPGTASGVMLGTLEDETGQINLVIWPRVFER